MNIVKKSITVGTLLITPFLLTTGVTSANSKLANNRPNVQTQRLGSTEQSLQQVADEQPTAMHNARSPFMKNDNAYWINRANLAGYKREGYRYPTINWNARDMGGYYAGHGKWTKTGVLYRGANLSQITNRGIQQMKQLHINNVIDLRSYYHQGGSDPGENTPNQPNPLNVKYTEDVVNTRADKRLINPYARAHGGEIAKYTTSFLTWSDARRAYHAFFMQLLHRNNGAIYFHCIQGDDRTGIVAMLYLSSLGVSKWHIYNDYLLTNYYHLKKPYLYKAREINSFFWGIRHYYGTMNNYLLSPSGVDLTNAQIIQMRKKYLVNYKGLN